MRLQETPLFPQLKARGQTVKNTASWAKDSFGERQRRLILLVLIGMTAGQAVVWYQGQFQALFFLTAYLEVDVRAGLHHPARRDRRWRRRSSSSSAGCPTRSGASRSSSAAA